MPPVQSSPDITPPSTWSQIVDRDPTHSHRYAERFRRLAAAGNDLVGEARLVDALAPCKAAILDAGCGPGRHSGYLHRAGHRVVGIDLDPVLIEIAQAEEPGPRYLVGDLANIILPPELSPGFDVILCAGNVLGFLHPATRQPVLSQFSNWLGAESRAVIGFGAGRGYEFEDFLNDAAACGLARSAVFASWDLRPFTSKSPFIVGIFERA